MSALDRVADALARDAKTLAGASAAARRRNKELGGGGDYVALLGEGERAKKQGKPKSANPYSAGTEEYDIWLEGYNDPALDRMEPRLSGMGGPQSFRRERGFRARLIGPAGVIGESPLMISENSARRWAAENSRGKNVVRVDVRPAFVDPGVA